MKELLVLALISLYLSGCVLTKVVTVPMRVTGSLIAKQILEDWNVELAHFVKVMPKALKEALAAQNKQLLQAS